MTSSEEGLEAGGKIDNNDIRPPWRIFYQYIKHGQKIDLQACAKA